MKKELTILFILLFSFSLVSAKCNLDVSLINQDPYPAVPGDYVKLVFQVTGTENIDCEYASIELLEKYPISFDPGESGFTQIKGGTFQRDYSSYLVVPYKVRLDEDALEGENRIEVLYGAEKTQNKSFLSKLFNIEVDDTRADFEIFIKDYDPKTKQITFEILNIAESDVEALTIEIPEQDTIKITGAKTNILGDLDSNEYTTADFKGVPSEGKIKIKITYSDTINQRRTLEKEVFFNPEYFSLSVESQKTPWYTYVILVIVLGGVFYHWYNRRKKKQQQQHNHKNRGRARLG